MTNGQTNHAVRQKYTTALSIKNNFIFQGNRSVRVNKPSIIKNKGFHLIHIFVISS